MNSWVLNLCPDPPLVSFLDLRMGPSLGLHIDVPLGPTVDPNLHLLSLNPFQDQSVDPSQDAFFTKEILGGTGLDP